MKYQITLLTALLAGSGLAQTTATTTIGEVTLTKAVPAAPAETVADPVIENDTQAAEPAQAEAPVQSSTSTETAPATRTQPVAPVQAAPVRNVAPVTPPSSAKPSSTSAAPRTTTAKPAAAPSQSQAAPAPRTTAPVAQPAAKPAPVRSTTPAVPAPRTAPATQATPKPAMSPVTAPSVSTSAPKANPVSSETNTTSTTTSAAANATATTAPSDLPAGWRHLSGDIFGSKAVTLPAGSKVQVAIEAVNRSTGRHIPHLLVDFGAESLPTQYYVNYNPARMNMAKYDYVVQAKVFDANGKMLYMSDARQPLPRDVAAKLKIDMRF
ncbi:YbaY family lipoprotein [Deinococcus sp. Marseille-Q6407]|uniref:YbaY family lipoprotein n=1 Tax=Deinococcus sp. Marseille-Q6407 TaxID=2969223 RepID=UPI0021BE9902|nr:YbaY family lipoprotein [Deinococcus sp. Marseille-Q6407]